MLTIAALKPPIAIAHANRGRRHVDETEVTDYLMPHDIIRRDRSADVWTLATMPICSLMLFPVAYRD